MKPTLLARLAPGLLLAAWAAPPGAAAPATTP